MSGNLRAESRDLVLRFFNGDEEKTNLWFETENPLLGGITPNIFEVIRGSDKLLKFIKELLEQNEP